MKILAIDPAVRSLGWAIFIAPQMSTGPRLVRCGLARSKADDDLTAALQLIAQVPRAEIQVVERPQIYSSRKSKGDSEDVARILIQCGVYAARDPHATELVKPHDWKGTIPKTGRLEAYIVHRRNTKELGNYLPDGVPAGLLHNVVDAVGLGLWWLRQNPPHSRV